MNNSFFTYFGQLELIAFFSGYPLLFAITVFITGRYVPKNDFIKRIPSFLPLSYALTGTLYLGFQLQKFHTGYTVENIKQVIQLPWLTGWALLSILFWIPAIGRKKVLSLVHSLVFFFFLVKDFFLQLLNVSADRDLIRNDMTIYTGSLVLNFTTLAIVTFTAFLLTWNKRRSNS